MKLEEIKGVGRVTADKIEELGVATVEEFAVAGEEILVALAESADKPMETVREWKAHAVELVGVPEEVAPEVVEEEVAEVAEVSTADVVEAEPVVPSNDVVSNSSDSDDVGGWLAEVASPLIEKGHGRRSILFRAGLKFNPENPRAFTKHINHSISIADNVKLAHSRES